MNRLVVAIVLVGCGGEPPLEGDPFPPPYDGPIVLDGPPGVFGTLRRGYVGFSDDGAKTLVRAAFEQTDTTISDSVDDNCRTLIVGGDPINNVTAGAISLDDGVLSATVTPDQAQRYVRELAGAFARERPISITATGAQVPAFTTTVAIPEGPLFQAQLPDTISRARGLSITWAPVATGSIVILLAESSSGPQSSTSVTCTFPASAGTAFVPPDRLNVLYGEAVLYVELSNVTRLDVAGFEVEVHAIREFDSANVDLE